MIRRMAEDLCMPVQINSASIHREPDGLAMSSRNCYITEDERSRVIVLKDTLEWIAVQIKGGNKDFVGLEGQAKQYIVEAGFEVDYVSISNSKTLNAAADDDLDITILGAMFTESARLIDNLSIVLG